MLRVYLDVSCLNRPDDDQQQARIRLETEAILIIMERFDDGQWLHLASDMVSIEINANSNLRRRRRAICLLPGASELAPLNDAIWTRAAECERMGLKPADAVHVAAAEAMQADVLLTCDDRFFKAGVRNRARLHVRIDNPLSWMKEQNDASDA